jgi:type II secretory pathway pseudopilin PulG
MPGLRRRLEGLTLIEIMIAASVLTLLTLGVMSLLVTMAQLEKNNRRMTEFALMGQNLEVLVRKYATDAFQFIEDNGLGVVIVLPDGRSHQLFFEDGDGDHRTLADNRIFFISADEPDNPILVARYVTRIDATQANEGNAPMFRLLNNNFPANADAFAPLIIEFQMGDYTLDPNGTCHQVTGPGFQNWTVRTSVAPRNHRDTG